MSRRWGLGFAVASALAAGTAWAAPFSYHPPGELIAGSGEGRVDSKVYAPSMRFPIEVGPAYANSQVYMAGGNQGPGGSQCDTENYSYPWWDNYCETRSWEMPLCPAGKGHQGQDIRPTTCENSKYWCVATADGSITHIGTYSVYLTAADGTRYDYLHMSTVQVSEGSKVKTGDHVGKVSNQYGGESTTIHLHFNIHQNVSGVGAVYVPPYTSLIKAYEQLIGEIGTGDLAQEEALFHAPLSDTAQSSDIDGDGKADLCGRAAAGFRCQLSGGTQFGTALEGPDISDANAWDDVSNYGTLRLADFDGDGKADLCGRANDGLYCWYSTGAGFGAAVAGPKLDDASSWNSVEYFSTLRVADFNGDKRADICVRGSEGIRCYPSTGKSFGAAVAGPPWSDAVGWNVVGYYATIRMGDVNGDGRADVCARGAGGMKCYLSDGNGFPTAVTGPEWSDAVGWNKVQYWSTIRLVDVNGDGKADLCARGALGFRCHLSTGSGFGDAVNGPEWSDADGWNDHSNYSTIRLADLDGDGDLDVCGRSNAGMLCSSWEGAGFQGTMKGPALADADGWDKPNRYRTLQFADFNGDGKADLCARAAAGVSCWLSTGTGFESAISGPAWSDASGWDVPKSYATIRFAGGKLLPAVPEGGADASTTGDAPVTDHASGGAAGSSSSDTGLTADGASTTDGSHAGGNSATPQSPAGDSGCNCRMAPTGSRSGLFWTACLALSALLARRLQRSASRRYW